MKQKNVKVEFAIIPSMWVDVAELHIKQHKENVSPDYSLEYTRIMVDDFIRRKCTHIGWLDCFCIERDEDFDVPIKVVIANYIHRHPNQPTVFYRTTLKGHDSWECVHTKAFMEQYNGLMRDAVTKLFTPKINPQQRI